jgi:alpha-glucosidase
MLVRDMDGAPHKRVAGAVLFFAAITLSMVSGLAGGNKSAPAARPKIIALEPPEKEFFAKELLYENIPIKAPGVVVDEALYAAYGNLSRMLTNLPMIASNLVAAGVELHIIGRDQVTTDLPEWRHDKGKPLAEYNGLTRDQRTRGMGGRLTSCGEENLLKLQKDKYFGRDICVHEFSHSIRNYGIPSGVREKFNEQYHRSLDKGLWKGSYAGSNPDEFFAELTMWYFGTHGDLHMDDPKPENGPEGLRKYDPEAFALLDDFYSGRIPISRVEPRPRRRFDARGIGSATNAPAAK